MGQTGFLGERHPDGGGADSRLGFLHESDDVVLSVAVDVPTIGTSPASEKNVCQTLDVLKRSPCETDTHTGAGPMPACGFCTKVMMSSFPSPLKSPTSGKLAVQREKLMPQADGWKPLLNSET